MRICAIGWRASRALGAVGGGDTRVIAVLSASVYVDAGGEILWIGGPGTVSHARAIHVVAVPSEVQVDDRVRLVPPPALTPWRPPPFPADAEAARRVRRNVARLVEDARVLPGPRGFGAWLLGDPLVFPLDTAGHRADNLAQACAADDPERAADAALALIGLGPGLTPAGDDFVGGAFFARALLAHAGLVDAPAWQAAASRVRAAAVRLTHPIGATLLGDLVAGEGWAPLHVLALALARDDATTALESARQLTQLGHSSGWDLLAGFVAGARR